MRIRCAPLLVALTAILAVACADDDPPQPEDDPTQQIEDGAAEDQIAVVNATYDLAVGKDQRVLLGVLTPDQELIGFGQVDIQLFFLGEQDASGSPEERGTASASWLAVPGMEPDTEADEPTVLTDTSGAGVYQGRVDFDTPGFYGLLVTAELADGRTVAGTTSVQVSAEPQLPAVGEDAPSVRQATLGEEDFDYTLAEIDSRAIADGKVPDPELHDRTIEDLLAAGDPMVLVVSTPVFCVSRFCGPITETIEELQQEFGDRAEFVHLEVWEDFEAKKINSSASRWIGTPDGGGTEPWVFYVDSEGVIQARWGNVYDKEELRGILEQLPAR